jgi:hypothetical protein
MKQLKLTLVAAAAIIVAASCKKDNDDYNNGGSNPPAPNVNAVVVSVAGDSAGIVQKLNEFRLLSGDPVNGTPGATGGRREVNWDGVPANLTNNNNFPFDFFGASDVALPAGRKRGLILKTTGTAFRVDTTDFSEIDASYASQFEAFSRKRLFVYMATNITEVTFKVPGTTTDAFVHGFGVIFNDVDDANSTSVEYFAGTKSLGVFKAKVASQGYSFVGVGFPDEKVTRVRITSGNGVLAAGTKDITSGGTKDLVVMDDFLYDEPKSIQ